VAQHTAVGSQCCEEKWKKLKLRKENGRREVDREEEKRS